MSHFTVMVIGNNPEEQLQPYHEYECTGIKDKYVIFVEADMEELQKEYEDNKEEYPSLDDFATNYHCYIKSSSGKYGKITNPNRKWDWYLLGGRWTGFLKLKDSANGKIGEPSLVSSVRAKPGYCDQALKKDIDFKAMREIAGQDAAKEWDRVNEAICNLPEAIGWTDVRETFKDDLKAAKEFYHAQPQVIAFNKVKDGLFDSLEDYTIPKDEYVQNAINGAISTYAAIKDSKWYEKGKMGWFGMASDEMSESEWNNQLNRMIDELPEDTLISIYDCHI